MQPDTTQGNHEGIRHIGIVSHLLSAHALHRRHIIFAIVPCLSTHGSTSENVTFLHLMP
jgi:hypothetical protein